MIHARFLSTQTALLLFAAALAALAPSRAAAAPGQAPAATLLLPYFEVDLTDPEGLTTLFSVNNAGEEPVVAHVVLWTDWGIPTYSFDVVLGVDDVQTINLRDPFMGLLPATDGRGLPGCTTPVDWPPLFVGELRRKHSGQATLEDGLCWGSRRLGTDRATGYVTVDVVKRCSGNELWLPGENVNYFPNFAIGTPNPDHFLIAYDDVLWGDAFYVSGVDDSAQGVELVAIPTGTGGGDPPRTFYERFGTDGHDNRVPLGHRYRGRFLDAGPFSGGTDLLVWLDTEHPTAPTSCQGHALARSCELTRLVFFDEDGTPQPEIVDRIRNVAARLEVGSTELPVEGAFGFFDLEHTYFDGCHTLPVGPYPLQAWVTTVMKADGRYSVGVSATRIPVPEP